MAFIEFEKSVKDEDWSMLDLHSHTHYEVYFLSKGSREYFWKDALYQISAPSLVVIPPSVVHKTEGGSFERHNVNVSSEYLNPFERAVLDEKSLKMIKLSTNEAKQLLDVFDEVYKQDESDKFYEQKVKTLFSGLIYLIYKIKGTEEEPKATNPIPIPPNVLKILDYLNVNYGEKITLDGLAQTFFMSKPTLIYNFNKFVGRSPIDFLLAVRLSKAKQMLVATKMSVGQIADKCGFSSANYFGLIFKKKEKVSPLDYRKIQLAKF